MALDKAKADETPFPPPDMSSPKSSLENLSFINSISEPKQNFEEDVIQGHNISNQIYSNIKTGKVFHALCENYRFLIERYQRVNGTKTLDKD